jgi:hypothetical protein
VRTSEVFGSFDWTDDECPIEKFSFDEPCEMIEGMIYLFTIGDTSVVLCCHTRQFLF